jgi:hypothetical protein
VSLAGPVYKLHLRRVGQFKGGGRAAKESSVLFRLTSEKPRIIVEINDNTGFIPSFLSESN